MSKRFLYTYGTTYVRIGIVVGLMALAFAVGLTVATLGLVHGVLG